MRTFFLQIFLAFWITTIGIFFVATALNPDGDHGSWENQLSFSEDDATHLNAFLIALYQRFGCAGIQKTGGSYELSNANGTILCGNHPSPMASSLVQRAVQAHTKQGAHIADQWVTATPVETAQGSFVVIHQRHYVERPYFPKLPPVAFPVSLIVTFLWAFILTRPVRALSKAFREFSSGDLSVRLPAERHRWSGLGGADVQSLMLDFNHMADRISSLITAQKTLVRDVSHELRSPLARLRLALEMAREEYPVASLSLERMEMEADRVNDLIGQMLTLSLMESTSDIVEKEQIEISDLIETLIPDLEFEAIARNCNIHFTKPNQPLYILGSSELLRRAIENVGRNAIRYTAQESTIDISVFENISSKKHSSLLDHNVVIQVADRGPGTPEESLKLLFQAFYRTDSARRDSTGGFGVGLSIAERAIQLHGGIITAANRAGGGLVISIVLPEAILPTTV